MEGSLDSASDTSSVEASGRIGIGAKRSEGSRHKASGGRCLAELTAGLSHEIRSMALEEPWRRKQ